MTLIDLLVVLIYLALTVAGVVHLSTLTVLVLVVAIIVERIVLGERLPAKVGT